MKYKSTGATNSSIALITLNQIAHGLWNKYTLKLSDYFHMAI